MSLLLKVTDSMGTKPIPTLGFGILTDTISQNSNSKSRDVDMDIFKFLQYTIQK